MAVLVAGRRQQRQPARSSRHGHWPSEAETFWTAFLRNLARRRLRGIKLVIKVAISKVLNTAWQRCCIHFIRNVLAHAGKSGRRVVSAFIVADELRPKLPTLAAFMDEAEPDVPASMGFAAQHRAKLHSTDEMDKP